MSVPGGRPIALSSFVARVRAIGGDGKCQEHEVPIRGQQVRIVSYTIDSGAVKRRMSLYLDSTGHKLQYVETRGDLKRPTATATETDVGLDFVRGTAQASNLWSGQLQVADGTLAEALRAPNLDVPEDMIRLVEQHCLR